MHVFHYMPDAYRGQKMLFDHLKLDFQVVVSLHVGTWNLILVFSRPSGSLNHRTIG